MKFTIPLSILASLAVASPTPHGNAGELEARTSGSCQNGLKYCGTVLLGLGWPRSLIISRTEGRPDWLSENSLDNVLFHCNSGSRLSFIASCNAPGFCKDGGPSKSDYCT
ncbi:hypothetical protein C8A00DRAFT_37161 [Chaetomidium leptoderma]|uniref:Uncharacterized protein n=1 Tax=Chaetomidium leptoderma TaxID=669021 RepID=A0AAN6VF01_9PEZI|nr:hypothetical protein C8A00DRAFT_37161 [Chaetomidium leptoderma]